VLYLNYAALENGKISSCIINHLTNNIPTMSHDSWTKESRTLDKKLNGKRTSEIKKSFIGERDVFKPSKAKKKKQSFTRRMILEFISEIKNLTFQYPKLSVGISFGFLELGVWF
jgi:hypothetical protein